MRGKGVIYGTQLIFTSDHRLTSLEYTYIKALFIANKIKIMELCKKKNQSVLPEEEVSVGFWTNCSCAVGWVHC